MKKVFSMILLLATLSALVFSTASAQGPTGTYVTGIACVNLEATAGNFTITFYDTTGAEATSIDDTITANGSKLYFTASISGLADGFLGSAVISSSVQMACSVNTQTGSGTLRVGTSNGVASADTGTKLYAPQVMNNLSGFSTYVAVQNADAAAATVTVKYFNSTGAEVYTDDVSIPVNATFIFYQDGDTDGGGADDLPAGFIGSATFESTSKLAGTVAMYNAGTGTSDAQLLSYNTFTGGATSVFGPRVVKNLSGLGYTSGFSCQNVGTAAATLSAVVTMFNQETSTTVTGTLAPTSNVAAGQSWAVYLGNTTSTPLDAVNRGYGSIQITATGSDVACIFNEDNRTTYAGLGSTYNGIPNANASDTMFFSQIVALGANSYRGGFQVANTTSTAASCTATFSNSDTYAFSLAANGSASLFAETILTNNKTNFNGSAQVVCDQPILGIYNLANPVAGGDSFSTNNGINR